MPAAGEKRIRPKLMIWFDHQGMTPFPNKKLRRALPRGPPPSSVDLTPSRRVSADKILVSPRGRMRLEEFHDQRRGGGGIAVTALVEQGAVSAPLVDG